MKKVLILGAGLVARPMIEYLLENGLSLTVASPEKERSDQMIKGNSAGKAVEWTMEQTGLLGDMVGEHDIVVSLLPYRFHTDVAKVCIDRRRPLVTTSYVKPEMQALDTEAAEAGIIILNEIGADPGIDHMTAMRVIDNIHSKGASVREFYSLCGALPAPEAADNPMGYKFSWSPKGVLMASCNDAQYLKDGERVYLSREELFSSRFSVNYPGIGEMEVYPNRDSLKYAGIYGIPEVKTLFRGTFRYPGWCETLYLMKAIDLFNEDERDYSGYSWGHFIAECAGTDRDNLRDMLIGITGKGEEARAIKAFEWLGLFDESDMGYGVASPFGIISDRMVSRMMLKEDERDMVVMQHTFLVVNPDRSKEVVKSGMVDYGTPVTNTAIARTVSLPAAIAVILIAGGNITLTGVHRPTLPEIYNPVLKHLERAGISMTEEYGLPLSEMIG